MPRPYNVPAKSVGARYASPACSSLIPFSKENTYKQAEGRCLTLGVLYHSRFIEGVPHKRAGGTVLPPAVFDAVSNITLNP